MTCGRGLLEGTLRTRATITALPAPVQRRIRSLYDDRVAQYRHGGRLRVPVAVKLASGKKAS